MKTDEELKQLAKDIWGGRVFTDRHVENARDLHLVFLSIGLMSRGELRRFAKNKPGMIYEYIDRANSVKVGGMPTFLSFQTLSEVETEKVMEYFHKIEKLMEEL